MKLTYSPDSLPEVDSTVIGGKGLALFQLFRADLPVPPPICISTAAYDLFVDHNSLGEKIGLELYRKKIGDMRWEEIWDASLRIQNLFLKGSLPDQIENDIFPKIEAAYANQPLVIRSSAPDEDGAGGSFAGLHESYVNITDAQELRKKIKRVWASLWSDRAILYRQELGLEVLTSKMAVVVQPFIEGSVSGVLFTKNPLDTNQMIVEAVHGLNQGLVDGAVAPDRWLISRENRKIVDYQEPENRNTLFTSAAARGVGGVSSEEIRDGRKDSAPLNDEELGRIVDLGFEIEHFYREARDVEWTIARGQYHILQARPITADTSGGSDDKRSWYLSLTRSYDNLLELRARITDELLPAMDNDSARLAEANLDDLASADLASELRRRTELNEHWTAIYWSDFIPFAHGVRLFGELYNEIIEPDDPFEFVSLLTGQEMLSTERNKLLAACARMALCDDQLRQKLSQGQPHDIEDEQFQLNINRLRSRFSTDYAGIGSDEAADKIICAMILQYTLVDGESYTGSMADRDLLEKAYLERARMKIPIDPEQLLFLARESYRIRDDDNIHIGRIGQEVERAAVIARKRLAGEGKKVAVDLPAGDLCLMLEGAYKETAPAKRNTEEIVNSMQARVKARQLQGQPASRGVAVGQARVIVQSGDLMHFQKGEVLVIDSIDPTMTFFAPLAAAIIERRGGMLIHGAIIAREYGIPCITGVVGATDYIATGDRVTVDGYLGICTVQRQDENIKAATTEVSVGDG